MIEHSEASFSHKDTKLLTKYITKAQELIRTTYAIVSNGSPPPFYKIAHCSECQYRNKCHTQLQERDCISLLPGMTPTVREKYHRKGITTITQLAHLFRPRRRSRALHITNRYQWELKALAIRDKKTYVIQAPDIHSQGVSIFIDFEGLPTEQSYYLLGCLVVSTSQEPKYYHWWADTPSQEQECFIQLLSLLHQYPDAPIYHYGSYESKALRSVLKALGKSYQQQWALLEPRLVNLLGYLRTHVYPPTYGNGLKEVAGFLGYTWSDSIADGYSSTEWRKAWEATNEVSVQEALIQYNRDDCMALSLLHHWFRQLTEGAITDSVQQVSEMKRHSPFRLQSNPEFGEDYDRISKASYFNYQREKIYWRGQPKKNTPKESPLSRRPQKTSKGLMVWQPKHVHEISVAPPLKRCPSCGSRSLRQGAKLYKTIQTDLAFTRTGVRQHVIEHRTRYSDCLECDGRTNNRSLRMMHYGDNLFALAVHYYVNYRLSNALISQLIQEQFGIWISPQYLVMNKYTWWNKSWKQEAEYIQRIVLNSPFIHIDETPVRLARENGYVWVCATPDSVFYHYSPTRSADVIKEILGDYKGIVISDFFPAYEAINVQRQKCLIHLIRDLNDDLFKSPFDTEFGEMVSEFRTLLRQIVETIEKYGLKQSRLKKHVSDTDRFYRKQVDCAHSSELASKYAKRFQKHWDELWTFLHHDNIPWNNNNAEAAIKAFAQHRRGFKGVMHPRGLRTYLEMLSLSQTCRYRNIPFLGVLRRKRGIWEHAREKSLPPFLPFAQARLYVHRLHFERKREWMQWVQSGKRPPFIPYNPHLTYRGEGWKGWQDWIGFEFLPFAKARVYVRSRKIKTMREYDKWSKSGKRPRNIPADPAQIYKNTGWVDINDWLGTKSRKKMRLSYEEAKKYMRSTNVRTQHQFFKWRKTGKRPDTIPSDPVKTYPEFEGWGAFLGTGRIANQRKRYWDYDLAKSFFRILNVDSRKHFHALCLDGRIPPEIPRNPEAYYRKKGTWKGYRDFLHLKGALKSIQKEY
ncbi:MAG: IS66 family transposase [Bacteroidetes bacterium]|nr:IS66 family transposase [Bacteroidota bacterium]